MRRSFAFVFACLFFGGCASSGRATHVMTVERVVYVEAPPERCAEPRARGPHAKYDPRPEPHRRPSRRAHDRRSSPRVERHHSRPVREMARASSDVERRR